jgi:hypothetical protein
VRKRGGHFTTVRLVPHTEQPFSRVMRVKVAMQQGAAAFAGDAAVGTPSA